MNKAKEEYEEARKIFYKEEWNINKKNSLIVYSEYYIKELEKQNEERLNIINEMMILLNDIFFMEDIGEIHNLIAKFEHEKITGKSIDEVLKDE